VRGIWTSRQKRQDDRQTSRGRIIGRQAEWQAENRKGGQQQTGGRKVVCLEETTNWQRGRQTSRWSGGMPCRQTGSGAVSTSR